jgi:hypothetical protein
MKPLFASLAFLIASSVSNRPSRWTGTEGGNNHGVRPFMMASVRGQESLSNPKPHARIFPWLCGFIFLAPMWANSPYFTTVLPNSFAYFASWAKIPLFAQGPW